MVTLTVTDNQGATDEATLEVEVTEPVDPPPNADPVAVISGTTCTYLSCPLSGSGSTDDGTITGYAWDFGDGETGTGVSPGHVYDEAGTWTVTLTVTDDDGATDSETAQVTTTEPPASTVAFRAGAGKDANTTSATVVVPASVQAGDQLVLVATTNNAATATTPSGWTLRSSAVDGTEMKSSVWTRTATAALAGSTVRVPLSVAGEDQPDGDGVQRSGSGDRRDLGSARHHGQHRALRAGGHGGHERVDGAAVLGRQGQHDSQLDNAGQRHPAYLHDRYGGGLLASVTGDAERRTGRQRWGR